MSLIPEQREQLRLSLLRYLDANVSSFGSSSALLLQQARAEGFAVDKSVIELEMKYLADKKLAALRDKKISPENRTWEITAEGRDHRAQLFNE